ncbi:MAG: putative mannose-6-phosphate isomerase GmuF [Chlamydiae bacterium]|nr:putative mannose-6-phosphate isomerase GmuF [Chlamydiota bacterium]
MIESYPLFLSPAYKHYLWGGSEIIKRFDRMVSPQIYAESWEASDREEGMTHILNGALRGKSLKEVLNQYPDLLSLSPIKRFPFLIKLIDAQKPLSIQVHPNDQNASLFGGEAKSEMWHILAADEKSHVYLGLKKPLSDEEIIEAIENQNLEQYLNKVPVKSGQTYYIPGGMLHSIGEGCMIYEVQQNSNTTYRLYDWGRVDYEGKKRPLHLEKALRTRVHHSQTVSLKIPKKVLNTDQATCWRLMSSPYFNFYKWDMKASITLQPSNVFRVFFVLEGSLAFNKLTDEATAGQTFIIPPNYEAQLLNSKNGAVTLLETSCPAR